MRNQANRADCEHCFGLCCVVPAFAASSDFAISKLAGQACPNLREDFRCGIHDRLRSVGFSGCTVYDCFGAGQRVAHDTFHSRDWRADPATASRMFQVFPVMRNLHELLWYLGEALDMPAARPIYPQLASVRDETERLAGQQADALIALDLEPHRRAAGAVLLRASQLARAQVLAMIRRSPRPGPPGRRCAGRDFEGADLIGRDFARADLRGASFRNACLIWADLTGADLTGADLIGADLRGARVCGADLTSSVFLTQFQVNAASGDTTTRLPASLVMPAHWQFSI